MPAAAKKPTGRPVGRPRKPDERKERLGQLPKAQLAAVVNMPTEPMEKPKKLGKDGSELWDQVVAFAGAWVKPTDQTVLALLCEAADRRASLLKLLDNSGGPVLFTDKGYAYANPAVAMVTTTEREMTTWLSQLGLTPSDRARIGVSTVTAVSKLDQLQSSRAQKYRG